MLLDNENFLTRQRHGAKLVIGRNAVSTLDSGRFLVKCTVVMADKQIDPSLTLRTLQEAHEALKEPGQDIVGLNVIAKDGKKIGKVAALFVDEAQRKVRFMRVRAGGFLGRGERQWLIPIDAITSIDEHEVHVDQAHHKIIGGQSMTRTS